MDPGSCDENANCTNSDGSFSCTCKKGFTGDGTVCEGTYECPERVFRASVVHRSFCLNIRQVSLCHSVVAVHFTNQNLRLVIRGSVNVFVF